MYSGNGEYSSVAAMLDYDIPINSNRDLMKHPLNVCHDARHRGSTWSWTTRVPTEPATRLAMSFAPDGNLLAVGTFCARHAAPLKADRSNWGESWRAGSTRIVLDVKQEDLTPAFIETAIAREGKAWADKVQQARDARQEYVSATREKVVSDYLTVAPVTFEPVIGPEKDDYGLRYISFYHPPRRMTPGQARWLAERLISMAQKVEKDVS